MAYAIIGRKRIYYETRGQGRPLLLLMGWQGNRTWWPESLLSRLENNFLLILMDHRGTGMSKDPFGLYSIKGLAKDATRVLDDIGLSSAAVLGVSMGGMVAQAMAIHYPDRVDRLILTSSSAKIGLVRGLNKEQQQAWLSYLRKRDRGLQLFIMDLLFSKDCKNSDSHDIKNFINRTNQQPTSMRSIIKQFMAIQKFDSRKKLKLFRKPTLVVTGDNDMIIGAHHSHALCRFIPHAKLHIIKGGTHAMLDAEAEELSSIYLDFLSNDARLNG
jgi:pimeloyl-ACP methyl ester carboxylesterase